MATEKPFRFGVLGGGGTPDLLTEHALEAERIGYSVFLVTDHLDLSGSHLAELSPVTALAFLAARTETIKLGTAVFNHDLRHPAVLAREAASLEIICGGRFEMGIGAGHTKYEYDWAGIRFDEPSVRVERFEEYVRVVKAILEEETATYAGKYFEITAMSGGPSPEGRPRPRPPLMIGGSRKRMLSIAAREADIVGINLNDVPGGTAAMMDARIEEIRAVAGDRLEDLELNNVVVTVVIGEGDPGEVFAEEIRRQKANDLEFAVGDLGMTEEELIESPVSLIGNVDSVVDELLRWRRRWGISYITIAYPDMEQFAPVVERLAGK